MSDAVDSDGLAEQNEELLEFLYAAPIGLAQTSADGSIQIINPLAMQMLMSITSRGAADNLFKTLWRLSPDLRNIIQGFDAPRGVVCDGHRIFVSPAGRNGLTDPMVLACKLVKLRADRFIIALSDVSSQVAQERRLKQAETWFATLLDGVNDYAVLSLDREGRIDAANAAAARQTGHLPVSMLGKPLDEIDTPERGAFSAADQLLITQRDGWHLDEGWRQRADGHRYWCQRLIAARSEDGSGPDRLIIGYTVVLRDVTRSGLGSVQLKQMLTTDHLTGACNRGHFFEIAERQRLESIRQGRPLALIAIDLDDFKTINDTHGHSVGDTVLKAVTERCLSLLRLGETFARIGGEEFVALLPAADLDAARSTANRLLDGIRSLTVAVPGGTLRITASLGCATLADPANTLSDLLEAADEQLYNAKKAGRNRVEPTG
ncbi:diguanylate cyclase [Polymorphobacter sp.]|uniref:sensor domain-containing diguanylate cyclase n=1 Tax=Polymorphobacter sp. TaxID=1909290 RepID=UPI003F72C57C